MIIRYASRVLDRAERTGGWLPCTAGASLGLGIGGLFLGAGLAWLFLGAGLAWLFLGAGLALTAIRPGGTSLRRRILIRQVRRQIAQFEKADAR